MDKLWFVNYWEHRKPVHRSRAVNLSEVAQAAILLLDSGGLRALTIRAVSKRINVAPASLYSRIRTVDDIFDLALDEALGTDQEVQNALSNSDLLALLTAFFRHLNCHNWACQVIGMRAPRGPNYLRLSEHIVKLLAEDEVVDPLGTAYTLSNFIIGCATTASMSNDERIAPINPEIAPNYARFHTEHTVDPNAILAAGLTALLTQKTT